MRQKRWFFWLVMGAALIGAFAARYPAAAITLPVAASTELEENPYALTLGGQVFDPLQGTPAFEARWNQPAAENGPDFFLVQLTGPTQDSWLKQIEALGIQMVQYIHPYTYVVWGTTAQVEALSAFQGRERSAAGFVRWTGPFLAAYRVPVQTQATRSSEVVQLQGLVFQGASWKTIVSGWESLGGKLLDSASLNETWKVVRLELPGQAIAEAARLPGVYTLQEIPTDGGMRGEMSNQINAGNLNSSGLPVTGYLAWLQSIGVNGSGVIIASVDGGMDTTHPDLVNRVVACVGVTCSGSQVGLDHGTHTAGIMAADGSSGAKDSRGFLRGLGMAPGANLVRQYYSPHYYQLSDGVYQLMTDSVKNGALVSGNSWGPSGSPLGYDLNTKLVDTGVRDANPDLPGNQPLIYVLSIMNGWGGISSQGTPDDAKNILPVGSTYAQYSTDGSPNPAINNISSNSAHGPARDGRNLPLLVAPGWYVESTVAGNKYRLIGGTSMASPHVSGSVALFIEAYRNQFTVDPSTALVKAAFLPVAHDLAGYQDADGEILGHPFDSKQGWGRLNTAAALAPGVPVQYYDAPTLFDQTGDTWEVILKAAVPGQPVRLMLAWTDAPGHGLGGSTPAWNNNLDLVVIYNGDTYRGNQFNPSGWSQPSATADIKNNTEGVFLGPTASGTFTVRVVASNLTSDGVPAVGDATDQDFALVCYNCLPHDPGFSLQAAPLVSEVCQPGIASFQVNVLLGTGPAQPVTLGTQNLPMGAGASFLPNPVTPPANSTLSVSTSGMTTAGTYLFSIQGSEPGYTETIPASFKVVIGTPPAPALVYPPEGAIASARPTLEWEAVPGATSYRVEIAATPAFTEMVYTQASLGITHTVTTILPEGQAFYWRAFASNLCGEGAASPAVQFTTQLINSDRDGVANEVEDGAPNQGDGNFDGVPDRLQDHVTSLHSLGGLAYFTLAAPEGLTFTQTQVLSPPAEGIPQDMVFSEGLVSFLLQGLLPGEAITLTLYAHGIPATIAYWGYGPASGREDDYYFLPRSGSPSASPLGRVVELRLVDGGLGDHESIANGQILHTGGPANYPHWILLFPVFKNFQGQN